MPSHHGRGHAARRSAARQLARSRHMHFATCPDSSAVEHWPAPRWTHDMCSELADANARAWDLTSAWHYQPPLHEPVTEAWGRLDAERRAELLHRLAVDRAQASVDAATRRVIDRARGQLGLSHSWDPVPPSASAAVRTAVARAVAGCALPAVPPGASLPLGAGSRTRLDRLAGAQQCLGASARGGTAAAQCRPVSAVLPQPVNDLDPTPAAEGV